MSLPIIALRTVRHENVEVYFILLKSSKLNKEYALLYFELTYFLSATSKNSEKNFNVFCGFFVQNSRIGAKDGFA